MKWKPYPEYKDSGVEWLGKIPARWTTIPVKWCFEVQLGKMLQNNSESEDDFLVPYIKALHVLWGRVDTSDLPEMWVSPTDIKQFGVRSGDLLVCEGGEVGRAGIVDSPPNPCIIQNALHRVRARNADVRFLQYVLHAVASAGWFDVLCNKATIAHFTREKLAELEMPLPPTIDVQRAIAAFLDRETARIDALIGKKGRQIELLQEKRAALISHAVTKGLDPNALMKDSGVEWLGKIPAHWDVKRLKYVAQLQSGDAITASEINESGAYPVYGGNGLRGYAAAFNHEGEYPLIGRQGALCGCINYAKGRFWASEHAVVALLIGQNVAVWLGELLRTMNLNRYSQSAAQPGLAVETIAALPLPVPPTAEQRTIATFITREAQHTESVTAKIRSSIELLREYRTALISAAVTGKIKVNDE